LAASVPKAEQERLVRFYSQLQNLKDILDRHVIASKFLPFLERNTNKRVYYNRLELDVQQRTMNLDGLGESFEIVAQQLEAFNRAPEVERFLVKNVQAGDKAVRFAISVVLKPELFK